MFGGSRIYFFYTISKEIKRELIGAEAFDVYLEKYKILQKDYLSTIEDGILRYAVITAFNEGFYNLRPNSLSVLSSIAFHISDEEKQSSQINEISNMVIDTLNSTPWISKYGLNYTQTMNLTYSEWTRMQKKLIVGNTPSATIPLE